MQRNRACGRLRTHHRKFTIFVRHAFEIDEGLHTQLKAAKENPLIYEVSITDQDGMVLVSTDEGLPGKSLPRRTPLSQLCSAIFCTR